MHDLEDRYMDDASDEEVRDAFKGKTLSLSDYRTGLFILEYNEDILGYDFALFGPAKDLAALLTELELKLPKEIRVMRNMMLKEARQDIVKRKSLEVKAPTNRKVYH